MKGTRKVGRAAGKVLDAEDRQLLAQAIILIAGFGSVIVAAAGFIGLAIRLFGIAAG